MQKRITTLSHFLLTFIITTHLAASAQNVNRNCEGVDSSDQKKVKLGPCGGGIVDHLAVSKPEPIYPPKAKAARATGRLFVQVQIDEEGKVISARVCSGPVSLRQAAIDAAYKARFSPSLLEGKPARFSGILTYNFLRR
jgi:TonB family protein